MSFDQNSATPPSLLAQAVASLLRHGLTAGAGALAAKGVLTGDQQTQVVTLGVSLGMAALAYAWSLIQKRNAAKK